ncbi:hypothetical protein [Agrococcus sp. SGAir0287]|uniref:hypothetical protein n=1 Tax=Agrococcus sp. SGAir0287 TaxID=2070347 RepID=UPI0010FA17E4|nr:hypothetical protein [Agrococcus sp. SGAir0287]
MRRLATAATLLAASLALSGCVLTPPSAPPPPTDAAPAPDPTSTQPSSSPDAAPSSTPTQAADGEPTGTVEGSTAVISNDGVTWRLELLDFGPAPLDQLTEYAGEDGAPAPAPPAGMEVGWGCFRATLEEAESGYGSLIDVVSQFTVPGGDDGWDYETVDRDLDLYGASGDVGTVIDRVCPVVLAPEGFDYAAITTITYGNQGDDLELQIPAP